MKRWIRASLLVVMAIFIFAGSALAFQDVQHSPGKEKINELQQRGIIHGVGSGKFQPDGLLTNAQCAAFLVNGLQLNLDRLRFIKEPKASDTFTKVADNAWYAKDFVIASLNNVPFPSDVDPDAPITREQFAFYQDHALEATGNYSFIELYVLLADENNVDSRYMTAIQHLLIGKIAELDDHNRFRPKADITRSEAAVMLYNAITFVKNHANDTMPPVQQNVAVQVKKINDEVNKVTLSWGEQPTTGYSIVIEAIRFSNNAAATIEYVLNTPPPGSLQAQHVTYPQAETYLSSKYKPVGERIFHAADSLPTSSPVKSQLLPPASK